MDDRISAPRRVQIPAYTDAWMRGDRFGGIVGQYRKPGDTSDTYRVKLDKSGRTIRVVADDCRDAEG